MIREILTFPDPLLKKKCAPVKEITNETRKLLDEMAETMYAAPGIGLAAPQIGEMVRAIVVDIGDDEELAREKKLYRLINPKIVAKSGKTEYEEGCLSIPTIREWVKRSELVTVEALDEQGRPVRIEADGLLAICLQHEIDHLDGILFVDRLSTSKRELVKPKLKELIAEKAKEEKE